MKKLKPDHKPERSYDYTSTKPLRSKQFIWGIIALVVTIVLAQTQLYRGNQYQAPTVRDNSLSLLEGGQLAPLPMATSNNAVATVALPDGEAIFFSFSGLGDGKTYQDIHSQSLAYDTRKGQWQSLPPVPGDKRRLASVAATIGTNVYLFGGYTVAADHSEVSTPETHILDSTNMTWQQGPDIPTPVDDSVALTYQDRYIYLISGWHNRGNVQNVQILDTETLTWSQGTDFPGHPLFGHSGGIVGNHMLILDGVKVLNEGTAQKSYGLSNDVYLGTINPNDPHDIQWTAIPPHPDAPLYRAAAVGDAARGQIIIVGGSTNPYNYNGIGYDKNPSHPSDRVYAFDLKTMRWQTLGRLTIPTMDHRGLLSHQGRYYTLGGMEHEQKVSNGFYWFALPESTH